MPSVRLAALLAVPLLTLAGCSLAEPSGTAAAARDRVLAEAQTTVQVVVRALGGTDVEAGAGWRSCQALPSWRYEGWARVDAPGLSREDGLDAVRAALAEEGRDDTGAVADKVVVETEGYDLVVAPAADGEWDLTFTTNACLTLGDEDSELVGSDADRELDLAP